MFVSKYIYENEKVGENHLFVIIDDDENLVPLEYFGLIVSSHIEKSKQNSKYRYNEFLKKNDKNGLKVDSIVKCDFIYSIPSENIKCRIGQVDIDDYIRFIDAFDNSFNEKD